MVSERNLGNAVLGRVTVQRAAPHPRAQAAHGLALGDHALDDAVGILLDDMKWHTQRSQIVRQHVLRKPRLLLIEIDRDQFELHRRTALQRQQDIQQRVGVFAAGQAHHDPITLGDHLKIFNRLTHRAT
jgi:hypothetical protein